MSLRAFLCALSGFARGLQYQLKANKYKIHSRRGAKRTKILTRFTSLCALRASVVTFYPRKSVNNHGGTKNTEGVKELSVRTFLGALSGFARGIQYQLKANKYSIRSRRGTKRTKILTRFTSLCALRASVVTFYQRESVNNHRDTENTEGAR